MTNLFPHLYSNPVHSPLRPVLLLRCWRSDFKKLYFRGQRTARLHWRIHCSACKKPGQRRPKGYRMFSLPQKDFSRINRCTNPHGFCLDGRFEWHVCRRRRKAKTPNHCASIFTISYLFHRFVYLSFIPNLLIVLPSKKSFCIKVSSNNALRKQTELVQMFVRPFRTK